MIPAPTVANLLAWSIQVLAVVLIGGGAIQLARLQSPRLRLASFRLLLVACLLLPFLPAAATGSMTEKPASAGGAVPAATSAAAVPNDSVIVTPGTGSPAGPARVDTRRALPAWTVAAALVVLGAGTLARLVWLAVGLLALRRLRVGAELASAPERASARGLASAPGRATPIDRAIDLAGATADIFMTPAVKHPVTFGVRHPVVLLPQSYESLDENEQVAVVCHELLHVRRRDWLQIVAEELVRAALWFQPAIWWLLARIDLSREQLVDQDVVAATERRRPYLNALVTLAMDPAGPVLRPASLFLGRAHLLQRVALLSREVRMSRPRVCVSLVLVTAALLVGGRFVVQALPLAAMPTTPSSAAPLTLPALPGSSMFRADSLLPELPTAPVQAAASAPPGGLAAASAQNRTHAEVLTRAEPIVAGQPVPADADFIVASEVTVQPAGDAVISGATEMFWLQGGKTIFHGSFSSPDVLGRADDMIVKATANTTVDVAGAARSALDAVRSWRFGAIDQPFKTVIGFNLARGEQSGPESNAMRVGSGVPAPVRVRNVAPVYPQEAQEKRIQGIVILELVIDGAGIPISAYVLRPVEGLSMAAVQAALQWRYQPDATYSRRIMTVTANFMLTGSEGGVVGGVEGGVAGGVAGGVQGGVVGGVAGGVVGGVAQTGSFGLPRAEWPNAIRVGGNIKAPTRIKNVNPVYPQIAQSARVQGVVIIDVLLVPDTSTVPPVATVQAGQIVRSIPLLDQAALDAVKQWQFVPTLLNGNPIPVIMTVTVNFSLQ